MNDPNQLLVPQLAMKAEMQPDRREKLPPAFIAVALALCAAFGLAFYNLLRFALQSELYSYVLLVPVVSVYLFATGRRTAPASGRNHPIVAGILFGVGAAVLLGFWSARISGVKLVQQDAVSLTTLSFVFLLAGTAAGFLSRSAFRTAAFPLVFLLFMAPFPVAMEQAIENFLQHGSAPPAYWFLKLAGTPVFRQDMVFQLPGITLQIAPECSGIRSSIVLFMTSLVAGHLFLRTPWKRAVLTFAVIPLALVRNGFRVFVIGELCVRVGPHMIDSVIHHHGGPIFFILSLVPFAVLTYYLVKSDRSVDRSKPHPLAS